MPDSMYPGMDDQSSPSHGDNAMPDEDMGNDKREEDRHGGESTLIPKSICEGMDLQVGDTINLKIVHEYEDEYEVQYEKDESNEREDMGGEMSGAMDKMDRMGT